MTRLRLATVAALLALSPAAGAAQRSIVIQSFDVLLRVQPNGDVQVTETIRPHFNGSWNGLFRDLSLEHRTAQNERRRLDVDVTRVTDGAGSPLKVEASSRGRWTRRLKIWVPDAHDATRTVVLHYVAHNAIRFFDQDSNVGPLDELYWNATGNAWEVPIEHATARVVLPGVEPKQYAAYTGAAGSTERAVRTRANGSVVDFAATRAFAPGEGLTVAVGWPPGVVARPTPASRLSRAIANGWPVLLPFLVFALALRAWMRNGRDPVARPVVVQYEPPDSLSPAEVGTLVDNKAQMHDITATLVDLAVRGYVHIQKRSDEHVLGLFSTTEYVFHLKKPREAWDGLRSHEVLYLSALFKYAEPSLSGAASLLSAGGHGGGVGIGGDDGTARDGGVAAVDGAGPGPTYGSVELSSLKNRFYKDLKGIRQAIYAELVQNDYYRRDPQKVQNSWIAGAVATLVVGILAAGWLSDHAIVPVEPVTLGAAAVVSGIILFFFALIMPARTVSGARTREKALGFREFLDRVEEDRYKRMITSPEMFERFLPFAMAFKVEEKWAKAFREMFTEPPQWYSGYGGAGFNAAAFSHDMHAMSSAASSTMSSSPSGSGGGGSSGGGSGGGGGGGF